MFDFPNAKDSGTDYSSRNLGKFGEVFFYIVCIYCVSYWLYIYIVFYLHLGHVSNNREIYGKLYGSQLINN